MPTRNSTTPLHDGVNNDAFERGLKAFLVLFYEAHLDQTYADKERNAVHSEWSESPMNWVM